MNTVLESSAAKPVAATVPPARVDLYSGIHRALRLFMGDTLAKVGAMDTADGAETAVTLTQVDRLLDLCLGHIAHENDFIHTAIEARQPGASQELAAEHRAHRETIAALQAETATLRAAPSPALALRLYRRLALFVAENLVHMHEEETEHNRALWAAYSDAELLALHERLVAQVPPAEMGLVLHWMVRALPPAERAEWLGGMQQQMPPEAFRGVLQAARAALGDTAWAKLARALRVPPAPGLVMA